MLAGCFFSWVETTFRDIVFNPSLGRAPHLERLMGHGASGAPTTSARTPWKPTKKLKPKKSRKPIGNRSSRCHHRLREMKSVWKDERSDLEEGLKAISEPNRCFWGPFPGFPEYQARHPSIRAPEAPCPIGRYRMDQIQYIDAMKPMEVPGMLSYKTQKQPRNRWPTNFYPC